ncbi:alpha/beta-hydrolase [Auriscalpium vulgare]|uniref:Alpha/beta-hydrolase n=1 Tax=Auriscalpium vulgare TaxID=40419 RepID=A0ACB8SD74_9AGAM|nr:alpha/beta-hydrolase [Auriscalpium vulgare]
MVVLSRLSPLFLASLVAASPVSTPNAALGDKMRFPPSSSPRLFCLLPFVPRALCPRQSTSTATVTTPIGTAHGTVTSGGASRFAVKYANVARWQESSVASTWQLPNGASDPAALPLACAQTDLDDSQFSEDCLSILLYVPPAITVASNVPTLLWIHGGSFVHGSATDAGLDGSALAKATNSIVAVIQYRLGALGFNAPNGPTNLALKDIINGLKFLRLTVPSFGGSASKITVAGQSSGANMIRALLAVPSASSLFQSAILQSDPMDYGFLSASVQGELQDYFNSQLNCAASDSACLLALSVDDVLNASDALNSNGINIDASATIEEPMRPVHDGTLITSTLDSTTPFPSVSKPVLVTTVQNEAGPAIYTAFQDPIAASFFDEVVQGSFEEPRASNLLASTNYAVPVLADGQAADARVQLEAMGTDQVWRCASWSFARSWATHGANAFVGLYTVGSTYPDNTGVPFCTQSGSVCHEDDIEIVFGTASNPTSAQSALITEMQARYSAFLRTGNPNPAGSGYTHWNAATSSNANSIHLGSSGMASVGACDPSFWGSSSVPFDYQVFDI